MDRFLIVLVSLTTGFYIVEKVGLWFWRHMIHTQAEAKGCVRPSVRPRTSQSDCRILCQPVASGVVLVAGVTSAMRHARAMARRSQAEIPVDLRARLETARLNLLALFRALDRMDLSRAEIPQSPIRQLFELDADYVEALWALDQPPASLDLPAMLRDTLAALDQLPEACARFRTHLPRRAHAVLAQLEITVRSGLDPAEAYSMVPRSQSPKRLSTPRRDL